MLVAACTGPWRPPGPAAPAAALRAVWRPPPDTGVPARACRQAVESKNAGAGACKRCSALHGIVAAFEAQRSPGLAAAAARHPCVSIPAGSAARGRARPSRPLFRCRRFQRVPHALSLITSHCGAPGPHSRRVEARRAHRYHRRPCRRRWRLLPHPTRQRSLPVLRRRQNAPGAGSA